MKKLIASVLASLVVGSVAFYAFYLPTPLPPSDISLDKVKTVKSVTYPVNTEVAGAWFNEAVGTVGSRG